MRDFLSIEPYVMVTNLFPFLSPTDIPALRLVNRHMACLGNSSSYWHRQLHRHFASLAAEAAAANLAGARNLYQLSYSAEFEGLSRVEAERFLAVYDARLVSEGYRLPTILHHMRREDWLLMDASGAVLADQVAVGSNLVLYNHVFSLIRSYYVSGPTFNSKRRDALRRSLLHWLVIFAPVAFSLQDILSRPETDIAALDQFGRNAIYYAASMANEEALGVLIDHRAAIDQIDTVHRQTALHQAVIANDISAVSMLCDYGADLCIQDKLGWCPAMHALKAGDFPVFYSLIQTFKFDFNQARADQDAMSIVDICDNVQDLFSEAVMAKYYEVTQAILNTRIADINEMFYIRDGVMISALHWVAAQGSVRFAQLLLSHGAAVNQVASDGKTALYCAAEKGLHGMTSLLLSEGASVLSVRTDDSTALFAAVRNQADTVVAQLLSAKSNPNVTLGCGTTALHQACVQGDCESAALLLQHGANVNAEQPCAITPLHTAARMGDLCLLRLLLRYGADIEAKQDSGATPLICAIQSRKRWAIYFLLSHFANPCVALNNGFTASDLVDRLNLRGAWDFGLQCQQVECLTRQQAANRLLAISRGGELFRPPEKRKRGSSISHASR